jgi:methylase of polypeptide subunit release factors
MTANHHTALDSLAAMLREAGYSQEAIWRTASVASRVRLPELVRVAKLLQTEGEEPLTLLVRLFHAGGSAPREVVDRLLPELDLEGLAAIGILSTDGDEVTGVLRIDEYEGLLLACDRDTSRPDQVMGMSPSTMLTVAHTPREHTAAALDVGTGSGVHALLAARHADHVVATDASPRALWMTSLNARLNGVENVETREGSFFEPVAGERFGLVVSNPPYIVSPDASFLYRDSGMEGDSLCRSLLAGLPGLLEQGGFATLQCNWIHGAAEKWWRPIERVLSGSGCDAFMVRLQTDDPFEYAARWSESHHAGDPGGYRSTVRRWVDHYRDTGIESITGTMVVLRRRAGGGGHRRAVSLGRSPKRPTGDALARLFEAQDRLTGLDDAALLGTPVRSATGLSVERFERGLGGRSIVVLDCDSALGVRRPVEPALASLVQALDGERSAREAGAVESLAGGLRDLVKLGFVVFADL